MIDTSKILALMMANASTDFKPEDAAEAIEALMRLGTGPFLAKSLIAMTLASTANQVQQAQLPDSFKAIFAAEVEAVLNTLVAPAEVADTVNIPVAPADGATYH